MAEAVGVGLSPRRPGFNPRPFGVEFNVNILGHVSLLILLFPTVSIIPRVTHAH